VINIYAKFEVSSSFIRSGKAGGKTPVLPDVGWGPGRSQLCQVS